MSVDGKSRCDWVPLDDPLYVAYHDLEWGTPAHDDRLLFEFLVLEAVQAGLSWGLVLHRRAHYRQVYDGFDPALVARYDEAKQAALLADPGIIRNRLKVAAAVQNARAFLRVQEEFGSFDQYIWQFVDGRPRVNGWRTGAEIPSVSPEAQAMSKDLKARGFVFVGPTICYAYMQACGLVNDHLVTCFRHAELIGG